MTTLAATRAPQHPSRHQEHHPHTGPPSRTQHEPRQPPPEVTRHPRTHSCATAAHQSPSDQQTAPGSSAGVHEHSPRTDTSTSQPSPETTPHDSTTDQDEPPLVPAGQKKTPRYDDTMTGKALHQHTATTPPRSPGSPPRSDDKHRPSAYCHSHSTPSSPHHSPQSTNQ